MSNITRRVTLYVDLPAGWQNKTQEEWYFSATPKPYHTSMPGDLRVAIEVDLPHVESTYLVDHAVKARYIEPVPIAKIPQST